MLNDLKEILSIPSVKGQAEAGAPFGREVRRALDWFLDTARGFGLTAVDVDGYCGYAEYGDPSLECVGVLCHLDVVPAGEGWDYEPYTLTVKNGYLCGRGVVDDKGATVACLHALKAIKDSGVSLKRRIRIIAGCDEESGSACLRYYAKHAEIPVMSIVPDADFPIINSEKGILRLKLHIKKDDVVRKNGISIHGGTTINVVPPDGTITIAKDSELFARLKEIASLGCGNGSVCGIFNSDIAKIALAAAGLNAEDFSASCTNETLSVSAKGVAGHAMAPHAADNALWKLFALFNMLSGQVSSPTMDAIYHNFCKHDCTEALGIAAEDEDSGKLTVSMDIIRDAGDCFEVSLDIRYPISTDKDKIKAGILAKMPSGTTADVLDHEPPLFIPKDSDMVKTLLKVYAECTGLEPRCLYCGGGTYARRLPNSIAFGPTFPGAKTNIHNIDEKISVEQFEKLPAIYKNAMVALTEAKKP